MILSARFVRRPRRTYRCDWCERPITGPYIRLYGSAEREPPWTLRLHPTGSCRPGNGEQSPKLAAALKAADESEPA